MSSLAGAIVRDANCNNMNAIGLNAENADFCGSTFLGARLDESKMCGARMDGIRIDGNTSFRGTNLAGISFNGAIFVEANGEERPCRYTDLATAGAVGIAAECAQERAAAEGRMMGAQGVAPEAAQVLEPRGQSLADVLLSGGTGPSGLAWSEVQTSALMELGTPDVPDARGAGGLDKNTATAGVA